MNVVLSIFGNKSPALNLASRGLSCNLRADCLTRRSSSNVGSLCKASSAADLSQIKQASVDSWSYSLLLWVNLLASRASESVCVAVSAFLPSEV